MEHIVRNNMWGEECPPCSTCWDYGKCRCEECHDMHLAKRRERSAKRKSRELGYEWDNPIVPAHEVRAHIHELQQQGMGLYIIARDAGVTLQCLQKIMKPKDIGRVKKQTAVKVLAVTMSRDWTPAVGIAQRKLFEIGLEGVSLNVVAEVVGVNRRCLYEIRKGIPKRIRRETFEKIMAFNPAKYPRDSRVVTHTRTIKRQFDEEKANTPKLRINSKQHKLNAGNTERREDALTGS